MPAAPSAPVSEVCTQTRPAPTLTPASTSSVSVSPPPKIPSPSTHQQFTVHGHFAGPGDHVGPAPNVTVNPHYQPNGDSIPIPHPRLVAQQSSTSATDQQIRVLTPSEIMRTLPSLCQENYEPQPLVRTCIRCGFFEFFVFFFIKASYDCFMCILHLPRMFFQDFFLFVFDQCLCVSNQCHDFNYNHCFINILKKRNIKIFFQLNFMQKCIK